jgi:hypothetical protein
MEEAESAWKTVLKQETIASLYTEINERLDYYFLWNLIQEVLRRWIERSKWNWLKEQKKWVFLLYL